MKSVRLITCIVLLIFTLSCNSKDKIVGKWKCFDDSKLNGQIIQVEKFGDNYHGFRMNLTERTYDSARGWKIGDVTWKNISFAEKGKYKVSFVARAVIDGEFKTKEFDGLIIFETENIIKVRDLVSDKEHATGENRYQRIK